MKLNRKLTRIALGMVLLLLLLAVCAGCQTQVKEWTKLSEHKEITPILQSDISEIHLRKGTPVYALLSEDEALDPWEEFLQSAEIRWVEKYKEEKNVNGGIETSILLRAVEEELYVYLASPLTQVERIRIGKDVYELNYDREFPFEESWQLAEENDWLKDSSKGD